MPLKISFIFWLHDISEVEKRVKLQNTVAGSLSAWKKEKRMLETKQNRRKEKKGNNEGKKEEVNGKGKERKK